MAANFVAINKQTLLAVQEKRSYNKGENQSLFARENFVFLWWYVYVSTLYLPYVLCVCVWARERERERIALEAEECEWGNILWQLDFKIFRDRDRERNGLNFTVSMNVC